MKTRSILLTTLCSLMLGMSFASCSENEDDELIIDPVEKPNYILNEGHWGANNAGIAMFIHPANGVAAEDKYLETNGKKLGDVANALLEEDDNIYVLLNGSKYVARLDLMLKEQARYTFPESDGEPRCMEVEGNYAYVTQYGGQVTKLNIKDMTVAGTFKGGDNLEGVVEKDGKLYVANSYAVDGSNNWIYNKEVFIINAHTMTLEKTIEVVDNPTKMYEIDDRIYLISQGNYADVPGALQVIDAQAGTSRKIINDATKITEGPDGWIYGVRATYDANWQLSNSFFTYHPSTGTISETSFLKDAASSFATDAIYLLEVDEETGFIYVGTTDYQNTGTIYAFDKDGKLFHTFDSGGVNPSAMIFMD
jgi:DNA-binding beta-propeller fold protein YncE